MCSNVVLLILFSYSLESAILNKLNLKSYLGQFDALLTNPGQFLILHQN